jgi:hypothetical protein
MANKIIKHYGVTGMRWGVRKYQRAAKRAKKNPTKIKYQQRADQIKERLLSDAKIKQMLGSDKFNNPRNIALAGVADFGVGFTLGYTGLSMVLGPASLTAASIGIIATHASLSYGSINKNDIDLGRKWIEQNIDNTKVKEYKVSSIKHSDFIAHYGVKGMQWGKITKDKPKPKSTNTTKESGGLDGLGRIITSLTNVNLGDLAGKIVRGEKEKMDDKSNKIDKIKELDRFDPKKESVESAVKKVNEAYKFADYTIVEMSINGEMNDFTDNCPSTTMAFELRRRGYDAEAGITGGTSQEYIQELWNIEDKDFEWTPPQEFEDLEREIRKMGVGARGFCIMYWEGGGGHICSFEVDKKGIVFIDAQSGKTSRDPNVAKQDNPRNYYKYAKSYGVVRVDHLKLNDDMARWVRKDD